ncbi:hypothetical protein C8R45DRAFT_1095698 [Mycena sanguinolenta]|nr:hypothetical protein C8R45DRAFT_1095698 [Mycena sanguinolenta]
MVSILDLPQEVVDKIVGEFKDDKASLRICALISPAFIPSSRQHLFSSVQLLGCNVHLFQALIGSSPLVTSHVRRLVVSVIPRQSRSTNILAPSTLIQLPNLTHLAVHDDPFGLRNLYGRFRPGLYHATTRARLLAVPAPAWCALEDALLGSSLSNVGAGATGAAPHPHLRTLTLSGCFSRSLADAPVVIGQPS